MKPDMELICGKIDKQIIQERMNFINSSTHPNPGEFVVLSDGSVTRVSYVMDGIIWTHEGGNFYLGEKHTSFTGNHEDFESFVLRRNLILTNETLPGDIWIRHHDSPSKVFRVVNLRVWKVEVQCARSGFFSGIRQRFSRT